MKTPPKQKKRPRLQSKKLQMKRQLNKKLPSRRPLDKKPQNRKPSKKWMHKKLQEMLLRHKLGLKEKLERRKLYPIRLLLEK